jgi:hypothetical protein
LKQIVYHAMDSVMYGMMNYIQWQLRHDVSTPGVLEEYLKKYASWDRFSYFKLMPIEKIVDEPGMISWQSPISSCFVENNRARALFFPASKKQRSNSPTLIILHSLMSSSDLGYRRIASQMNRQGWNVVFPHLPFHYSRTPLHHANGALAITSNLVRTAETLRQAVQEIRQLIHLCQDRGTEQIGLLATSYGGWIGSLLLSVEEVDFAILLQPIINLNLALFESPLKRIMGSLLLSHQISHEHLDRHAHLTAPSYGMPLTSPKRIMVIGGAFDHIAPPKELKHFTSTWNVHYEEVSQGHFGYQAMRRALICMNTLCQAPQ